MNFQNDPLIHYIHGKSIGLLFSASDGVYKPCFFDIAQAVELTFLEDESNFKKILNYLLNGQYKNAIKVTAYEADLTYKDAKLRLIRFNMIQLGCFLHYSENKILNRQNLSNVRSFVSGLEGFEYDEATILKFLDFDFPGVKFEDKI